ncbi:20251_t:CDS:2, partial [Cetraspora pellucida]
YQTLNENQMKVFKRLETHYNNIIIDGNIEPLRIIIMRTADTGKSYLINAIWQLLQKIATRNGIESFSIIVLVLTRVAAFNIHRTMIHSALSILINSNNIDIKDESLKQLQKKLNGIRYIIINEKSIVGCCMLALIDIRLCQAFPENHNHVWWMISYITGNSEEQCHFRNILMCLYDDNNQFSNATYILPRKVEVNKININMLKSLNSPIARIYTIHTGGNEASKADSDMAKGLESQILLAMGTYVMLRANLYVEAWLVNKAIGTIYDILFEENQGPPALPIAVFVKFDAYNSLMIIFMDNKRTIPIPSIR